MTSPAERSPVETPGVVSARRLRLFGRIAPAAILVGSSLILIGWAFNVRWLIHPQSTWPVVVPWTAIWLALLSAALLIQVTRAPTARNVGTARTLCGVVVVLALVVLVEYSRGTIGGIDRLWFPSRVAVTNSTWPGRPSVQTALSVISLALLIGLLRVDAPRLRLPMTIGIIVSTVPSAIALGGYVFNVPALFTASGAFGLSLITANGLLLLTMATIASRPDRPRMAKLLARPDWVSLRRLGLMLAGFPVAVQIFRLIFEELGVANQSAWALAVSLGTVAAGVGVYQITADQHHAMLDRLTLATELASSQEHYRLLAENSTDVVLLAREGVIDWVSPSVKDVLGGGPEDWIGRAVTDFIHPDDLAAFLGVRAAMALTTVSVFRLRVITDVGRQHWVEVHAKHYRGENGATDGTIASMSVVDEAVAAEAQLDRLARTDALTGLANRGQALSFLHDHLEHPRRPGADLAVLFCDVDHFKSVNDEFGHAAGDVVLTSLSSRIASRIRPGDLVARLGGDEFIVFLVGVHGLDEAASIAEQLRLLACEPIDVDGGLVSSSLSIGVTVALADESPDSLIARADDAMYRAKREGRNQVVRIAPQ